MATTKEDFLRWLTPIFQQMIEETCTEMIQEQCAAIVQEECKKVVEAYVQQMITKMVFEKAAQNVMNATMGQLQPQVYPVAPPTQVFVQPVQEQVVKSKSEVYETFNKFIPGAKALAENAQAAQRQTVAEAIPDKKKFAPTKEMKGMFNDIVSSIPQEEVDRHRTNN
jgi:hypothetical protein